MGTGVDDSRFMEGVDGARRGGVGAEGRGVTKSPSLGGWAMPGGKADIEGVLGGA